MLAQLA
jgi:hypothetical protein